MKKSTKNLVIGGTAGAILGLGFGCLMNAFSCKDQNGQAAPEEPQEPANQAAPAPTDKK